ncbi:F-Box/Lrr-Repeat Protein 6 [Manis pentadactyla]|nr:F-Box/Lrr-Repeat Protein 6 [Manis pentadactyla]
MGVYRIRATGQFQHPDIHAYFENEIFMSVLKIWVSGLNFQNAAALRATVMALTGGSGLCSLYLEATRVCDSVVSS